MNRTTSIALVALFTSAAALSLFAQQSPTTRQASTGGKSPHETTSAVIDRDRVTITYGRPFSKNPANGEMRKIWGGLVPYGKAWRMGSDEATLLITQNPIVFGETTIPAGAYTLYLVPMEDGTAKLAFSSKLGGWGIPVDETKDVARIEGKKESTASQIDQFTISVGKGESGGGVIKLMWENTQFSFPFTVAK